MQRRSFIRNVSAFSGMLVISHELAKRCFQNFLTADGFLTHVSQINRAGEVLQANGYRVISQFVTGLMAQLDCKLSL